MAESYVLDSNVYVSALRDPDSLATLKRFLIKYGPRTRLHAVVALELRAGVRTDAHARALDSLIGVYEDEDMVLAPSFASYAHAGRALAALVVREGWRGGDPDGLADALLAASCRDASVTLVTDNARHFAALQRQLRGFRFQSWSDARAALAPPTAAPRR